MVGKHPLWYFHIHSHDNRGRSDRYRSKTKIFSHLPPSSGEIRCQASASRQPQATTLFPAIRLKLNTKLMQKQYKGNNIVLVTLSQIITQISFPTNCTNCINCSSPKLHVITMLSTLIVDFPSNNRSGSVSTKSVRFSPIIEARYIRYPSRKENKAKSYSSEDYERFQQVMI